MTNIRYDDTSQRAEGNAYMIFVKRKFRDHSFWGKKIMQKEAEFATFANS